MLDEGLGDLGAGAVAGAQEQQPRSSPSRLDLVWWRRREREPGMEREPGVAEKVPAAEQVGPVVDVATVGRAASGADDTGVAEFRQVVGHQVLRLPDQLHELADPAVATTELADQLPSQRIAQQPEDLRRLGRSHSHTISVRFDSLQVDGSGVRHRTPATTSPPVGVAVMPDGPLRVRPVAY